VFDLGSGSKDFTMSECSWSRGGRGDSSYTGGNGSKNDVLATCTHRTPPHPNTCSIPTTATAAVAITLNMNDTATATR